MFKNFNYFIGSLYYKLLSATYSITKNTFSKNTLKITGTFFKSFYKISGQDNIIGIQNKIIKSRIKIIGTANVLDIRSSEVFNSHISFNGNNNVLEIMEGCIVRNTNIIIRGNNCKISLAKDSVFNGIRMVNCGNKNSISIGEKCMFSDNIEIWSSDSHPIYNEAGAIVNQDKSILIGNNVWVGTRVNILKGVTIGDGAIIGMGSTVLKDVPNKSVCAGVPGKIIKENVSWSIYYPS